MKISFTQNFLVRQKSDIDYNVTAKEMPNLMIHWGTYLFRLSWPTEVVINVMHALLSEDITS